MNGEADMWARLSLMKGNSVAAVGRQINVQRIVATIATRGQQVDNGGRKLFARG
jgi:hypothetical protein